MSDTDRGGHRSIARLALSLALLIFLSLALAALIGRGKGLREDVLLENLPLTISLRPTTAGGRKEGTRRPRSIPVKAPP